MRTKEWIEDNTSSTRYRGIVAGIVLYTVTGQKVAGRRQSSAKYAAKTLQFLQNVHPREYGPWPQEATGHL